jgi:transposase
MKFIIEFKKKEDEIFIEKLLTSLGFKYQKIEKSDIKDDMNSRVFTKENADKSEEFMGINMENFKKQFGLK